MSQILSMIKNLSAAEKKGMRSITKDEYFKSLDSVERIVRKIEYDSNVHRIETIEIPEINYNVRKTSENQNVTIDPSNMIGLSSSVFMGPCEEVTASDIQERRNRKLLMENLSSNVQDHDVEITKKSIETVDNVVISCKVENITNKNKIDTLECLGTDQKICCVTGRNTMKLISDADESCPIENIDISNVAMAKHNKERDLGSVQGDLIDFISNQKSVNTPDVDVIVFPKVETMSPNKVLDSIREENDIKKNGFTDLSNEEKIYLDRQQGRNGLSDNILELIEDLFSDRSIASNNYLNMRIKSSLLYNGFVKTKLIFSHRRVKAFTRDRDLIFQSLRRSEKLQLKDDKVFRIEPLPEEYDFLKKILVMNLPKEISTSNEAGSLMEKYGPVKKTMLMSEGLDTYQLSRRIKKLLPGNLKSLTYAVVEFENSDDGYRALSENHDNSSTLIVARCRRGNQRVSPLMSKYINVCGQELDFPRTVLQIYDEEPGRARLQLDESHGSKNCLECSPTPVEKPRKEEMNRRRTLIFRARKIK